MQQRLLDSDQNLTFDLHQLNVVARSLKPGKSFTPAQKGQPVPLARPLIAVSHSCPRKSIHQTFLPDFPAIWLGRRSPFLVGCHSPARSGLRLARSLKPANTRVPAQNGHPVPFIRLYTEDSHSWPQDPTHQTFFGEPALTAARSIPGFRSTRNWAANSGATTARRRLNRGTLGVVIHSE